MTLLLPSLRKWSGLFFQFLHSPPLLRNLSLRVFSSLNQQELSAWGPHHPSWAVSRFTCCFLSWVRWLPQCHPPMPCGNLRFKCPWGRMPHALHNRHWRAHVEWPLQSVIPVSLIFVSLCQVCICGMHLFWKYVCYFIRSFYNQYLSLHWMISFTHPFPFLKMIKENATGEPVNKCLVPGTRGFSFYFGPGRFFLVHLLHIIILWDDWRKQFVRHCSVSNGMDRMKKGWVYVTIFKILVWFSFYKDLILGGA